MTLGGAGVGAFPEITEHPGISFLHQAGGFAPQNPPPPVSRVSCEDSCLIAGCPWLAEE